MAKLTAAAMPNRPYPVVVVSCLFILAGLVGLVYHATEFDSANQNRYEFGWICLLRLLAIVFGIFMLRGNNWARWGALTWIAYHVILTAFHSWSDFAMHCLIGAVISYAVLSSEASTYFRGAETT